MDVNWGTAAGSSGGTILILGVVFKFLQPILLKKMANGHANGSTGERPVSFWENKLHGLGEDVQKGFRDSLQISVIPILNRQTEILDEMRADGKELSKAIVKLALRDEVREEMRRSKAANA